MTSLTKRPVIGITLDRESNGDYATEPYYVLRSNYAAASINAGGLPVALPYAIGNIGQMLDLLDAVIVTGGMFDIHPSVYGAKVGSEKLHLKPERTDFERRLILEALERDTPILGICGGMQLLGVVVGADLLQHIPTEVPNCLRHVQSESPSEPAHEVEIKEGTHLAELLGANRIDVNSVHHQAISEPGPNAVVSAIAPDGIVEAIELPDRRFAIGVQWHPEYLCAGEEALFDGLISAARQRIGIMPAVDHG